MTTKVTKNLATTDFVKHPEITYISKAANNSFFALIDGRLYSTHANSSSNITSTSGRGTTGQCGYYGLDNLKLIAIPTHSPIKKVVGGYKSTAAALLENGDLYVWGSNDNGQLGLGTTTDVGYPTLSTTSVTDVYDHPSNGEYVAENGKIIILKTDGLLYAAGYNANGQLGVGNTTQQSSWTQVLNITAGTVKSVWNLGGHKGALVVQKTDNTVWVCGYNGHGALGNATTTTQNQLIDVTTAWIPNTTYEVKEVVWNGSLWNSAENTYNTMGMFSDDGTNQTVRMAGRNDRGQLGDTTTTQRTTPVTPTGIPTTGLVDFVAVGSPMALKLLTSTGDLWSWGNNAYGQVGDGTTTNRTTPTTVETTVAAIFDHGAHSHIDGHAAQHFILKDDDVIYGTGYNVTSNLGDGTTTNATSYTKVILELPAGETPVDMGSYASSTPGRVMVLITNYNNMYVWGSNVRYGIRDGQSNLNVRVPVQVNLPNVK